VNARIHMTKDPALVLEGVTKRFEDGPTTVTAVDELSLSIEPGTMCALTGASGSGKSTVLHLAAAMIGPSSGALRVGGRDITGLGAAGAAALRREQVGIVFQRYNLVPSLTALENVTLPLEYAGRSVREARALGSAALEKVGIPLPHDRFPDALSGGQQQRVAIARALAVPRALVLADEPTGALDSTTGDQVMRLLLEVAQAGAGVVVVTHDPRVASFADRVVSLRDGRIVSDSAAPGAVLPPPVDAGVTTGSPR
jgi:putative ABC transport system ATP-binding protein